MRVNFSGKYTRRIRFQIVYVISPIQFYYLLEKDNVNYLNGMNQFTLHFKNDYSFLLHMNHILRQAYIFWVCFKFLHDSSSRVRRINLDWYSVKCEANKTGIMSEKNHIQRQSHWFSVYYIFHGFWTCFFQILDSACNAWRDVNFCLLLSQ